MLKINVISNNIAWKRYMRNPNKELEKKIKDFNKRFINYKNNIIFFTLLLSGDKEIKKLNYRFRKKNKSTDVLSFPFYNKNEFKKKIRKEKELYLGDIIININKIKNKKSKSSFKKEFDKLWIHGLAHLFGYNHKKNNDFLEMKKVEKKFHSFLK